MALRTLLRQGAGYGAVGAIQLLLDWVVFVGLSALGVNTISANLIGRVGGALLGFWLNGVITFRGQGGRRLGWTRFSRFLLSWTVMSLLSTLAVVLLDRNAGLQWAWLAKPAVDALLALCGFVISRYWIYR
ncbi:MAG TPA: GtrA family protein [Lysobacter sp.]|nr:GtrA family protein [Lysobacter sp.]